jgi:hypothetical protein
MEDEKRALLVFTCPNCAEIASPTYTKRDLETALEVRELPVCHIMCGHSWKRKLSAQEQTNLKNAMDKGLLFA